MKNNIFIFTAPGFSPDLYTNILTHLFKEHSGELIEAITLLKIAYQHDSTPNFKKELNLIKENISIQLSNLVNSKVKKWDRRQENWSKTIDKIILNKNFLSLYSEVFDWMQKNEIHLKVVASDQLDRYLESQTSNHRYEFIFDLTGAPKKDFMRISLALLTQESRLHIFEVTRDFRHFKHQLIHEYIDEDGGEHYKYHTLNIPIYKVRKIQIDTEETIQEWEKMIANNYPIDKIIQSIQAKISQLAASESITEIKNKLILFNRRWLEIKQQEKTGIITTEQAKTSTILLTKNLQAEIEDIKKLIQL